EFRDLELAEDALQEALIVAAAKWPRSGLPDNAAGWLYVVARRKAIDLLRRAARENKRAIASSGASIPAAQEASIVPATGMMGMYGAGEVPDERLGLIFACCHPAINEPARVALTLQALSALSTADIAAAFLTKETTLAQRIVRAKRKIKAAGIPFAVPDLQQWPERIHTVLSVIYLIFNAGYTAHSGEALLKTDL
ncbi:MAG: RNA polymerase sigma factor, partial [Leptospiraceae bacterium]|nr:RNA polymerase sigma factor [Leptospiraceae bacterium]